MAEWLVADAIGIAGGVLAAALAVVVFRAGRGSPSSRWLSALLGVEAGIQVISLEKPEFGLAGRLASSIFLHALLAAPFVYLFFLATLDSPLVRRFRVRLMRRVLGSFAFLLQGVALPFTARHVIQDRPAPDALSFVPGIAFLLFVVASVFGLIVALSALRRASNPEARSRARAYAWAFGARDALFMAFFLFALFDPFVKIGTPWALRIDPYVLALPGFATLFFAALLSYGMLRARLFDLDLRLKRGVSRGTIAAVFIAIYVVGSQLAQLALAPNFGPIAGLVAAGALMFLIVPLQRAAERVADALMPSVKATPEYLEERKLGVYRSALADAYSGGRSASPMEEALLGRLRNELGISERDHAVLAFAMRAGTPASELDPALPTRYRILRLLGAGSFGRAYLAQDAELSREVVVKVIPSRGLDVAAEARRLAAVRHPNIVTIHDIVRAGDDVGLVMEFVEGGSLKARLEQGPLTPAELRLVADGLLRALEVVHAAGIIHRDIKPANVLLAADGSAKLADFGVAREASPDATMADGTEPSSTGTPRYMSPEQAKGLRATARSDLYAAGLTLFEAAVGEAYFAPHPNESAVEMRRRAARPPLPETRVAAAREELRGWLARALHADPTQRFASATEMREAHAATISPRV